MMTVFHHVLVELQDNIHKGIKIGNIRQSMRNAKKAGLLVHDFLIFGCPRKTKERTAETENFAKDLDPDPAQFFLIMVYPEIEAYEWAKENNYLLTEDYSKWLTSEGLHNTLISRPGLTNEELVELCDEARREFYLRPIYIWSTFRRMVFHPKESKRILKSSRTFLKYLYRGSFPKKSG